MRSPIFSVAKQDLERQGDDESKAIKRDTLIS
jgi:hypothetical protein